MDTIYVKQCDSNLLRICLPTRGAVATLSIISFLAGFIDVEDEECAPPRTLQEHASTLRQVLLIFFQFANALLLLASIVENPFLVQLYVWYTLSFIVMGVVVSLLGFLTRFEDDGPCYSCIHLTSEIGFLFAVARCLPLVDTYRKHLDGETVLSYIKLCN